MDESSHKMVKMLTQQIGTMFNPLIQNTNHNYKLLANQMGQIVDFFGAPQALPLPTTQISNIKPVEMLDNEVAPINQGQP